MKVDEDTGEHLSGVIFELKREGTNEVKTATTDGSGEIVFDNLFPGIYKIIEKKTGNEYQLNENPISVDVRFNQQTDIVVGNKKQKGSVKVIKQDKEDSEIKLSGVKFELYDENLNVLETLETNENGEAFSREYPSVGKKYYLREIETKEEYQLNEELIPIKLEKNIQKEIIVENQMKKGWIRIIKQDLENNNIRLNRG